jgi:hypothetical protein
MINGYWISQTVRAAADLRLADHMAGGARTADEIAELESSNPRATYRLMRACAALGLLRDEGEGRFSSTATGELLRSDAPGALRDSALVSGAPAFWLPWGLLPAAVRSGRSQAPEALGASTMDYLSEHPEDARRFATVMSAMTQTGLGDLVRLIDTTGVSLAVDIGGSNGDLLAGLLRADPALHGRVLDLPHVVAGADWITRGSEFGGRLSAVGGDCLQEVPAADLYLLKAVLHAKDDAGCVRILRNCRAAALPGGRVVVIENVLGVAGGPPVGELLDINMLAVSEGQERDLAEYDALFEAAGWRRTAALRTRGPRSVLELVPAE